MVLVVHWVLGYYNRKLSRGAQREILFKYVIVRALQHVKIWCIRLPGAEQQSEDWHTKSKVANLWASCFSLSDFLYFDLNLEPVLGNQIAKYQKLRKQLSEEWDIYFYFYFRFWSYDPSSAFGFFPIFNKGLMVDKVTSGFYVILRTVAQTLAFRVMVLKFVSF